MGKKLYVGNLSFSVTDADLEDLFAPFGEVRSARWSRIARRVEAVASASSRWHLTPRPSRPSMPCTTKNMAAAA